jgi:hypothetical protein
MTREGNYPFWRSQPLTGFRDGAGAQTGFVPCIIDVPARQEKPAHPYGCHLIRIPVRREKPAVRDRAAGLAVAKRVRTHLGVRAADHHELFLAATALLQPL